MIAGAGTAEPDLWCTYAAVRTLAWLDRLDSVPEPEATVAYLANRRNADGGFAWSRGMPSDAWAAFYCTQAMRDLGTPLADTSGLWTWLESTWSGTAYAMMPGQAPDVWATHFSARTAVEICGRDVPDRTAMLDWLRGLQTRGGGLAWTPEHADTGAADVRACYYGIAAWRALANHQPVDPPWDVEALVSGLLSQQDDTGGFRFAEDTEVPCLWATYRATGALSALGRKPADSVEAYVLGQRGPSGAFVRWEGYPVEDVWASFCAAGTLTDLPGQAVDAVVAALARFACSGGGYTYREPAEAWDALTTAAVVLRGDPRAADMVRWLESCQLPNEGGVMYMPGRGAEIRCTAWALAAGAFATDAKGRALVAQWLVAMQNPDGGFGYWEGRGSDMVSTASAVAAAKAVGAELDRAGLARFLSSCRVGESYAHTPGDRPTLRSTLQAHRVRHELGEPDASGVAEVLRAHHVKGGGYANEGNRMPDLLSTYEAVLAADVHGVAIDADHVGRFVARVSTVDKATWTPLAPLGDDPLARCLAALLSDRLDGRRTALPAVVLS